MNKQKQGRLRRQPRQPVRSTRKILGVVWSFSSDETAQDAVRDIRAKKYELRPGSFATDAAFYSTSDDEGHCLILVGSGSMFDGGFLATCGACVQKYGGTRLQESTRTQAMVKWADGQWQKSQKQQRKTTRRLMKEMIRKMTPRE